MTFAAGRFVGSGFLTGRTGVYRPAWRGAVDATCRPSSRLGSEARAQQSPKDVEIIAIADIALKPDALGAAEDLSLVITVVPPLSARNTRGTSPARISVLAAMRTSIIGHY
jgi:hypothetical protein